MRYSIVKEYFLYRLHYSKEQLALNEFHEFCDHVNNYSLEYKDILIYRKNFVIAMAFKEETLSWRYKKFCDLIKEEVLKCGEQ